VLLSLHRKSVLSPVTPLLYGVEGGGVAELVEGSDGSASGAVRVASKVVVAAKVVVFDVRGQHVPYGGDDRVFDRDEGLESADAAGQASVATEDSLMPASSSSFSSRLASRDVQPAGCCGSGSGHAAGFRGVNRHVNQHHRYKGCVSAGQSI
jgi:hypothetical protein